MELNQVKKLLHNKGNNYQNQETTHRMGGNLFHGRKAIHLNM
jgi:hypothetical protein